MQGDPDGLCGIYALLNFLRARAITANDEAIFHELLISAEKLGLLTAYRLYDGFDEHVLLQIFQTTADRNRWPFRAILLGAFGHGTFSDKLKVVLDAEGEIVTSVNASGHWVLTYGASKSGFLIDDPDRTVVPKRRAISKRGHKIPSDQGVVLLQVSKSGAAI
jgi:hypothetical protein